MLELFWISLMSDPVKVAIIGLLCTVLSLTFVPKFWELLKLVLEGRKQQKKEIEQTSKKQEREIESLRAQLNAVTIRLEIIIPFLKKKFGEDPDAMELLENFDLKTNTTSCKT